MALHCFWILLDGTIVVPDSRHILAVVAAPIAFGETDESINKTFKEYNESPMTNHEGRARETILLRVINRNHIRIRKNKSRNNQTLSVQLFQLTEERKEVLSRWARYILPLIDDKFADVVIHQLKYKSRLVTSLNLLAKECSSGGDEVLTVLTQSQLSELYKNNEL